MTWQQTLTSKHRTGKTLSSEIKRLERKGASVDEIYSRMRRKGFELREINEYFETERSLQSITIS